MCDFERYMTDNRLSLLLLVGLLLLSLPSRSEEAVADSTVTPTAIDSIDRAAFDSIAARDDFVTASLVISAPLKRLYSVFGHATLRMECPMHQLDCIYTFESDTNVGTFMTGVAGKAKAKYVAVPTDSFLSDSRQIGREVRQYRLNLTPKEKQELWRLLDEEMMAGAYRNFNLLFTNCLTTSIINVQRCLVGEHFEWGPKRYPQNMKDGDLFRHAVRHSPWAEFLFVTFGGTAYERFSVQEYRLTPETIIPMLREARIINDSTGESRFVVTDPGIILVKDGGKDKGVPVSPIMVFGVLLALSLAVTAAEWMAGCHRLARWFDILLFTAQTIMAVLMLYITFFSELFVSTWNWYLLVYLPLPLFIWRFLHRREHARCWWAYCALLVLFIAATPLIGVLDLPHQLITATLLVRCLSRGFDAKRCPDLCNL